MQHDAAVGVKGSWHYPISKNSKEGWPGPWNANLESWSSYRGKAELEFYTVESHFKLKGEVAVTYGLEPSIKEAGARVPRRGRSTCVPLYRELNCGKSRALEEITPCSNGCIPKGLLHPTTRHWKMQEIRTSWQKVCSLPCPRTQGS